MFPLWAADIYLILDPVKICLSQIEDESNNMNIKIRCALYDKKVVGHNIQRQLSNQSTWFCMNV